MFRIFLAVATLAISLNLSGEAVAQTEARASSSVSHQHFMRNQHQLHRGNHHHPHGNRHMRYGNPVPARR
jgi:hypothetical protein